MGWEEGDSRGVQWEGVVEVGRGKGAGKVGRGEGGRRGGQGRRGQ